MDPAVDGEDVPRIDGGIWSGGIGIGNGISAEGEDRFDSATGSSLLHQFLEGVGLIDNMVEKQKRESDKLQRSDGSD